MPAALVARPDLALTPEEADLSTAAIAAFTTAIGGRAKLLETLQVASDAPEVDGVVTLLMDPRYGGWSLRRICKAANLTIADLFAAYKKALIVKAHLQATQVVATHLVAVVDDVMKRSQPHEVACEGCHGMGTIPLAVAGQPPAPTECPACKGSGHVIAQPDLDRQKVALELGQLLTKGGGINLQQNTLVAGGGGSATFGPGALDQLQQAVGEILTPRSRRSAPASPPIDVTAIPAVPLAAEAP